MTKPIKDGSMKVQIPASWTASSTATPASPTVAIASDAELKCVTCFQITAKEDATPLTAKGNSFRCKKCNALKSRVNNLFRTADSDDASSIAEDFKSMS